MQEQPANRQWQTIEISAKDFNSRLDQLRSQSAPGTLFSRLALIHQVAKAYAVETLGESVHSLTDLNIEEITDPPMYDYTLDDAVIIQFSYTK